MSCGLHPSSSCPRDRNQPTCAEAKSTRTLLLLLTCLWGAVAESQGGLLRLEGGPDRCAGRVEVLHNGTWGTVCDDGWGVPEGQVVCRQLGCGTLLSVAPGTRYGAGTGEIWLDEVNCTGEERNISECRARPWGEHNCHHMEDASVECSDSSIKTLGNLQLVNGPNRCAGRVEVLHNHQWGTVCDDGWDLVDAAVVCRQLGCGTALVATSGAHFGRGHDPIWLDEVNCTGSEDELWHCPASRRGQNNCFHGEDVGVICSGSGIADLVSLRLANGSSPCSGRLEVFHDQRWGGICTDGWDLADANVVCRQLGCGAARSAVESTWPGPGDGLVWVEAVECSGREAALLECKVKLWGAESCKSKGHAGVLCSEDKGSSSNSTELRLVDGMNRCAGRVEVLHDGQWGTICDDSWDLQDAMVVCRQLGCGRATAAPGQARFGQGMGRIWLDELSCTGNEDALSQCRAQPWGQNNCNHGEDASVVCSGDAGDALSTVRLVNGPHRCAGRVEIFHKQQWGTVCDNGWDLSDAEVVCRQLGCGRALAAPAGAFFGRGMDPIWLERVACRGRENSLEECRVRRWGTSCSHEEDAAVVCSDPTSAEVAEVRLADGPNPCTGRVEVLHDGQWGTICDDMWDLQDAAVVCRQLGCGRATAAPGQARFGQGMGRIWLDEVSCVGNEDALSQCRAQPWGQNNCNHGEDAGAVCSDAKVTEGLQIRLANGSNRCAGRVEVLYHEQWGTVCDDGWDLKDAKVVCRQLGCGTAVAALGQAHFGQGLDAIWFYAVECTGMESNFSQCSASSWGLHNCNHEEDAGVVCSGTNPLQVRLKDGPGPCAGQVEVLYNATWHGVCSSSWSLLEAGVVCKQLGCGPAQAAPVGAHQDGRTLLEGLSCRGTESLLLECQQRGMGLGPCGQGAAAVVCTEPKGASPSCSVLVALVALVMVLSGVLLWLNLQRRCMAAAHGAPRHPGHQSSSATSFQPVGAIYHPTTAEAPEDTDTETMQLMDTAAP